MIEPDMRMLLIVMLVLVALAGAALAQTPARRSPADYSWGVYVAVLAVSLWGGLIAHARQYAEARPPKRPFFALLVDVGSSGLVGVATFFACEAMSVDRLITAVLIAVFGHMGARALWIADQAGMRFLRKRAELLGDSSAMPIDDDGESKTSQRSKR